MIFVETTIFTKMLADYLSDDEFKELQVALLTDPEAGDLIKGTGGLRKIRWSAKGHGKRGGVRIIYYWQVQKCQIYLLTIYAKNEMSDLTAKDKKLLAEMVKGWK